MKTNLPQQKVNMYKPQQKSYPFTKPLRVEWGKMGQQGKMGHLTFF